MSLIERIKSELDALHEKDQFRVLRDIKKDDLKLEPIKMFQG